MNGFNKIISIYRKRFWSTLSLLFLCCLTPVYGQNATNEIKPEFGYIQIVSETDSFYVVVNRDYKDPRFVRFADLDSLKLEAGIQHLTIIKPYHVDIRFSTKVIADSTRRVGFNMRQFQKNRRNKSLSSYPRLYWGGMYKIISDSDTDLYIENEFAGTGSAVIDSSGVFEIRGVQPNGKSISRRLRLDEVVTFESIDFYYRPDKNTSRLLGVIPGVSQYYKRQQLKSGLIFGTFSLLTGLAVNQELRLRDAKSEFELARTTYNKETDPVRLVELGNLADQLFEEQQQISSRRNWLIAGVSVVYLTNIVDAFIPPNSGFRGDITLDPYLDFNHAGASGGVSFKKAF